MKCGSYSYIHQFLFRDVSLIFFRYFLVAAMKFALFILVLIPLAYAATIPMEEDDIDKKISSKYFSSTYISLFFFPVNYRVQAFSEGCKKMAYHVLVGVKFKVVFLLVILPYQGYKVQSVLQYLPKNNGKSDILFWHSPTETESGVRLYDRQQTLKHENT